MNETPSIAVLGAGAMGSLFGGLLTEGGLDVTLIDVWREHVDAINRDGLNMLGHGGDRFIPIKASADPATLAPVDVVFVQCKAADTADALRGAAPIFGEHTMAISFQNGLGNEEQIGEVIGEDKVLGGLTAQGASIEGPGVIRNYGDLPSYIGEMAGGLSDRVRHLAAAFTAHGLQTQPSEDIRADIWKKLMVNVGVSPTSGVTNLTIGQVMELPEMRQTIFHLLDEAAAVALAEGIALDVAASRDALIQITGPGGTGGNKSSLCNDILKRRPTEIDVINGAIVRLGARHGVPTPVNKAFVATVKALESHYT